MRHIAILLSNLRVKLKRQQANAEITAEQIGELEKLTEDQTQLAMEMELGKKEPPTKAGGSKSDTK